MVKPLDSFKRYGDTAIHAYWERMRMPESHICVICEKKLTVRTLVQVVPYLDEEDGGAICSSCVQ